MWGYLRFKKCFVVEETFDKIKAEGTYDSKNVFLVGNIKNSDVT